ncbi:MAG TPA: hypothetical protein VFY65_07705 [Longimicrobium sp.]|nr:hypothetical protein [Longimicrobium sp.]
MEPGSQQDLEISKHIRVDTVTLSNRTSHEARIPIGPDSALVTLEWETGSRDGRRTPYRGRVIIPEHPSSDRFVTRNTGVGAKSDSIVAVTVVIEHTRTRGDEAQTRAVFVELGGDGESQVRIP